MLLLSSTINTLIWATQFPYLEEHREYPREARGISGIVWEISYDQIILPFIFCSTWKISGDDAANGWVGKKQSFLSTRAEDLVQFTLNFWVIYLCSLEICQYLSFHINRDRDTNFHGILARIFIVGLLPISASLLWLVVQTNIKSSHFLQWLLQWSDHFFIFQNEEHMVLTK